MTVIVLLPFLKVSELIRFSQLNKACCHIMQAIVNFRVLFKTWSLNFTPTQEEEILISASRALQVAAKLLMLKSIVRSSRIIVFKRVSFEKFTSSIPDISKLFDKSFEELRNFSITKV